MSWTALSERVNNTETSRSGGKVESSSASPAARIQARARDLSALLVCAASGFVGGFIGSYSAGVKESAVRRIVRGARSVSGTECGAECWSKMRMQPATMTINWVTTFKR